MKTHIRRLLAIILISILSVNTAYASTKGTVDNNSTIEDTKIFIEEIEDKYKSMLKHDDSSSEADMDPKILEPLEKEHAIKMTKLAYERRARSKVVYIYQLHFDGYIDIDTRNSCENILKVLEKNYGIDLDLTKVKNDFIEKEKQRQEDIKRRKQIQKEIKHYKGKKRLINLSLNVLFSWREHGWNYSQTKSHTYYPGLDIRMNSNDSTSYKIRPDCSGFVGTVLREYGIKLFQEQAFQDIMSEARGISDIGTTFMVAHIDDLKKDPKLEVLDFDINILQDGDIMIRMPGQNGYKGGHVEVFIGPESSVTAGTDLTTVDMQIVNWGSRDDLSRLFPIESRTENSQNNWLYDIALAEDGEAYPYIENTNPYAISTEANNLKLQTRKINANQYVYIIRVHDEESYPLYTGYELKWSRNK